MVHAGDAFLEDRARLRLRHRPKAGSSFGALRGILEHPDEAVLVAWSPDGLRLATHPDHRTVTLRGWHRVLLNTESEARARESVAFLD